MNNKDETIKKKDWRVRKELITSSEEEEMKKAPQMGELKLACLLMKKLIYHIVIISLLLRT